MWLWSAVSHSVRTDKLLDAGNLLGQFKPHIVNLCSANRYFKTLRVQSLYWPQPPHSEHSESETEKKTKGVSVPLWYSAGETVGQAWAGVMWAVAFICQEKKKVRKSEWERAETEHCVVKVEINTNTVERRRGSQDKVELYLSSSFLLFPPSLLPPPDSRSSRRLTWLWELYFKTARRAEHTHTLTAGKSYWKHKVCKHYFYWIFFLCWVSFKEVFIHSVRKLSLFLTEFWFHRSLLSFPLDFYMDLGL